MGKARNPSPYFRHQRRPTTNRSVKTVRVVVSACPTSIEKSVRHVSAFVLASHGVTEGNLDIAFVSAAAMKKLHGQWLGKASLTDVITFDLRAEPKYSTDRSFVDAQIVI